MQVSCISSFHFFKSFNSFLLPVSSGFMDQETFEPLVISWLQIRHPEPNPPECHHACQHWVKIVWHVLFLQFSRDELRWHLCPPLPVKLNIISIPNTPEVSLQWFSWLGTGCHWCHRKREDAIFTHAKLVQFYSVWKGWPSKCQLEPAEPGLPVSQIPQYLAHNTAGAIVNCEAVAVEMELLWEVCCALLKSCKPGSEKHIYTLIHACIQV